MANVSIKCAKCGMSLPHWSVHEDPCSGLKEEDLNEPEQTELMTWECPRCHRIHNELKVTCDCSVNIPVKITTTHNCSGCSYSCSNPPYYPGNW